MPYLIRNPGQPDERAIKLRPGANTIGRQPNNSIVTPHMSLSRHHAQIIVSDRSTVLIDMDSRNGTFVNDTRIERSELRPNDVVRCGDVVFQYVNDLAPVPALNILQRVSPETTRVAFEDLVQASETGNLRGTALKLRSQRAEERAVAKLQILLEVGKELSLLGDPDRLLERMLELLFEIIDVDRAAILLVDSATGELDVKAVKLRAADSNCAFYSSQIAQYVLTHGEGILSADALSDVRFESAASVVGLSIHASMCVPLKPKEATIGVLYADSLSSTNLYSAEDLEFLTALANQAAIAIENAKLYERLQAEAVMRARFERFFPLSVSRKLKEGGELDIIDTEVTALFSDISGFTEMSSTMAPRQTIAMLNEYFAVMVEDIVFHYEGTLEKYIGDALLAIWGAPYRQPDDAERAVRAAIAMQQALVRLNQRWMDRGDRPIQIHIGINTGPVAAGNIGSPQLIQYAAIGDTTNVASRICNVAKGGEIVISHSTRDRILSLGLPLDTLDPVVVKGKAEPLQLYRVRWAELPETRSAWS